MAGAVFDVLHRAEEEDVEIESQALELLTKIGLETSLRYAIHMISPAHLVCVKRKVERLINLEISLSSSDLQGSEVGVTDVQRVYKLFFDVKRSASFLNSHSESYLFHEQGEVLGAGVFGHEYWCKYTSVPRVPRR